MVNSYNYLINAMCELINIVVDPTPILDFLETKGTNTESIQDIIASLSSEELSTLWGIFINLKYSKDPKDIIKKLNINLKNWSKNYNKL